MYPPMSQQMAMCDKERRDSHFKRISMPHTYHTMPNPFWPATPRNEVGEYMLEAPRNWEHIDNQENWQKLGDYWLHKIENDYANMEPYNVRNEDEQKHCLDVTGFGDEEHRCRGLVMKVIHARGTKHQVYLVPDEEDDLVAKDQMGNVFDTPHSWITSTHHGEHNQCRVKIEILNQSLKKNEFRSLAYVGSREIHKIATAQAKILQMDVSRRERWQEMLTGNQAQITLALTAQAPAHTAICTSFQCT